MSSSKSTATLLSILFFLSGLAGLVYEISWSRILSTILGNTSLAISIVVSIFLGGLAAGSFISAGIKRPMNPLLVYGILEILIGVYSVFTPGLSDWINHAYSGLYAGVSESFFLSVLLKAAFAGAMLLIPTIAMGATLPILIRSFSPTERSHSAGRLYGLNTAGAVAGTLLAGYVLLPSIGISRTIYSTAALNLLLGIAALLLSRIGTREESAEEPAPWFHPAYLLFFFTGFATLAYEILWTRALSMFFGSSVYAFSAILAAFLFGIASGSSYYAKRIPENADPYQFFSLIQFRIALSAVFFIGIFMGIPILLIQIFRVTYHSFPLFQTAQFLLITIAVFYTTFLSGAAFPAALHFFRNQPGSAQSYAGSIYGYNTIGSILGSICAAFVLIPWLGVERSIRIVVLINLILGILCFRRAATQKRGIILVGAISLLMLIFLPRWNQSIYNAGFYAFAYKYVPVEGGDERRPQSKGKMSLDLIGSAEAGGSPSSGLATPLEELNLIYYGEGLAATVAVTEDDEGTRSLLINGKPDASNVPTGDMRTQLLLGHLPFLMVDEPGDALVIGLGSGVTAGAMSTYNAGKIDAVEIEPEVAAASEYFAEENLGILRKPGFRLIYDDGRNVIQHSTHQYSVITSEPSNLWMSGVANLFTKEFFESVRGRLRSGGILCQWIHLYQISGRDVRIFLKTMHSVFPHLGIWVDGSDMLVLASDRPIRPDVQRIADRMSKADRQEFLARSNLNPESVIRAYLGDERIVKILRKELPVNTDDHPILEFSAPRSLFQNRSAQIIRELRQIKFIADQND